MKSAFFLLISLLVLTACPALFAQMTISGQVQDEEGKPIAHVTVLSTGIDRTVQTDKDGNFTVTPNVNRSVSLTFSHAACVPKTMRIEPEDQSLLVILHTQAFPLEGITVTAGRAVEGQSPVSFQTLDRETIDRDFDIGEVPALLESTPNLFSYSDAGGGLGYSYLKIRGFDARRTPVYINGIPLNDPEDHALYFVDLPDFAANADNIQVQRGVGNSLYGDASFGGSINILTSPLTSSRQFVGEMGYGGFLQGSETVGLIRKSSILYSTGLLNSGWSISGRWLTQYSDGYRRNSWYDGTAYYLSIGRLDPNMITTLNIYGGPMRTHAAWDGITRETSHVDRRINWYLYDNETDNFNQPHFELHNIYQIAEHTRLSNTLYLIKGDGYYEQYKSHQHLNDYGLSNNPDDRSDLVRRKWVDKNQMGINSRLDRQNGRHNTAVGASYYFFESEHWGEVIWADELSPSLLNIDDPARYYEYFGTYHNMAVYAARSQQFGERLNVSANLQLRYLLKDINQTAMGRYSGHIYELDWLFLSPRIGMTFQFNESVASYASFSIASHEPNDDMIDDSDDPDDFPRLEVIDDSVSPIVFGDPLVEAERVYDFELGINYRNSVLSANANVFWMEYRNEIVPDGGLNDDGFPTYGNAKRSVHRGIELAISYAPRQNLTLEANYAFNDNLIKEYDQNIYDWDNDSLMVISRRDAVTPGFPRFLANIVIDYSIGRARLIYRLRGVGRQMVSLTGRFADIEGELVDVSIEPYAISSIKGMVTIASLYGGQVSIEGRVDNLFDQKYETFGYNWGNEYYYWPAAERNWFVNLKLAIL